jgi:cystathionine beta-lyase/cystathionine gamma-synthase
MLAGSPCPSPLVSFMSHDLGESRPLVPPLYQSSVYTLPDLDALDAIMEAQAPGFIYARDGHPNARLLASRLASLEGADWALVTSSGMAALSALLLSSLEQGARIVASNRLYGRTTQLVQQELARFGVPFAFVDTNDLAAVEQVLKSPARVLLVETLSNPLLRVADLPGLARLCAASGCLLVVDNTFATPVLCRPLEMGAAFVMESLTKMIGGHADITLGMAAGKGPDSLAEVSQAMSIWGFSANPFDCWLAERGLASLTLRMKAAQESALTLARWLASAAGVKAVHYPGLESHPDHSLARRVLSGGFGNMLSFELEGGRDAVNRFLRAGGIVFSPSLGNTSTTCSHPDTTSHRHDSPAQKQRQGITPGLVRLSVGIEDVAEIQEALSRGLAAVQRASDTAVSGP